MSRRLRSNKTHVVAGWTVRVGNPGMLGDCWVVSGRGRPRCYESYREAVAAARRAADGSHLDGGWGIL